MTPINTTLGSISSSLDRLGAIQGLGIIAILACLWMGVSGLFDLVLSRYTLGEPWERLSLNAQGRLRGFLTVVVVVSAIAALWLIFAPKST